MISRGSIHAACLRALLPAGTDAKSVEGILRDVREQGELRDVTNQQHTQQDLLEVLKTDSLFERVGTDKYRIQPAVMQQYSDAPGDSALPAAVPAEPAASSPATPGPALSDQNKPTPKRQKSKLSTPTPPLRANPTRAGRPKSTSETGRANSSGAPRNSSQSGARATAKASPAKASPAKQTQSAGKAAKGSKQSTLAAPGAQHASAAGPAGAPRSRPQGSAARITKLAADPNTRKPTTQLNLNIKVLKTVPPAVKPAAPPQPVRLTAAEILAQQEAERAVRAATRAAALAAALPPAEAHSEEVWLERHVVEFCSRFHKALELPELTLAHLRVRLGAWRVDDAAGAAGGEAAAEDRGLAVEVFTAFYRLVSIVVRLYSEEAPSRQVSRWKKCLTALTWPEVLQRLLRACARASSSVGGAQPAGRDCLVLQQLRATGPEAAGAEAVGSQALPRIERVEWLRVLCLLCDLALQCEAARESVEEGMANVEGAVRRLRLVQQAQRKKVKAVREEERAARKRHREAQDALVIAKSARAAADAANGDAAPAGGAGGADGDADGNRENMPAKPPPTLEELRTLERNAAQFQEQHKKAKMQADKQIKAQSSNSERVSSTWAIRVSTLGEDAAGRSYWAGLGGESREVLVGLSDGRAALARHGTSPAAPWVPNGSASASHLRPSAAVPAVAGAGRERNGVVVGPGAAAEGSGSIQAIVDALDADGKEGRMRASLTTLLASWREEDTQKAHQEALVLQRAASRRVIGTRSQTGTFAKVSAVQNDPDAPVADSAVQLAHVQDVASVMAAATALKQRLKEVMQDAAALHQPDDATAALLPMAAEDALAACGYEGTAAFDYAQAVDQLRSAVVATEGAVHVLQQTEPPPVATQQSEDMVDSAEVGPDDEDGEEEEEEEEERASSSIENGVDTKDVEMDENVQEPSGGGCRGDGVAASGAHTNGADGGQSCDGPAAVAAGNQNGVVSCVGGKGARAAERDYVQRSARAGARGWMADRERASWLAAVNEATTVAGIAFAAECLAFHLPQRRK